MSKVARSVIVLLLLLFFCAVPTSLCAAEKAVPKVVRVGYFIYEGFQEGGVGEPKSGYGYDYLQKIRYYTGWKYEYVYGSFAKLLKMLEAGEIDIMGNISCTKERESKFVFSAEPQSREAYYIFAKRENRELSGADLSSFVGKRIGVTRNSFQEEMLLKWLEQNGLDCTIERFDDLADTMQPLEKGQIDAVADVKLVYVRTPTDRLRKVVRLGDSPCFFAINKKRPDLYDELNSAHAEILAGSEYYDKDVINSNANLDSNLTAEQQSFVKSLGAVKVGYIDSLRPVVFSDKKTGRLQGLAALYLEAMHRRYGISFEPIAFDEPNAMQSALLRGELDIMLPIGYSYWQAENYHISLSNTFVEALVSIVYKNAEQSGFERIAVLDSSPTRRNYVQLHYPEAEIVDASSDMQIVNMIEFGEADCYVALTHRLNWLEEAYPQVRDFHRTVLPSPMKFSMALRSDSTQLLAVVNKGLNLVSNAEKYDALVAATQVKESFSLVRYVRNNPIKIIAVVIVVLSVFMLRQYSHARQMSYRAERDLMTGLYNRTTVKAKMQQYLSMWEGKPCAFLMIDIDDLKTINDLWGHMAGDEAIVGMAGALKSQFRESDVVGRIGGDEYAVFLGGIASKEVLTPILERLQRAVSQTPILDGKVQLHCSIGVALGVAGRVSLDDLYSQADEALYRVKKNGKNSFAYYEKD